MKQRKRARQEAPKAAPASPAAADIPSMAHMHTLPARNSTPLHAQTPVDRTPVIPAEPSHPNAQPPPSSLAFKDNNSRAVHDDLARQQATVCRKTAGRKGGGKGLQAGEQVAAAAAAASSEQEYGFGLFKVVKAARLSFKQQKASQSSGAEATSLPLPLPLPQLEVATQRAGVATRGTAQGAGAVVPMHPTRLGFESGADSEVEVSGEGSDEAFAPEGSEDESGQQSEEEASESEGEAYHPKRNGRTRKARPTRVLGGGKRKAPPVRVSKEGQQQATPLVAEVSGEADTVFWMQGWTACCGGHFFIQRNIALLWNFRIQAEMQCLRSCPDLRP